VIIFGDIFLLFGWSRDELKPVLRHYPVTAHGCSNEAVQIEDDSFGVFVASEESHAAYSWL
jgi:hypothetical protein